MPQIFSILILFCEALVALQGTFANQNTIIVSISQNIKFIYVLYEIFLSDYDLIFIWILGSFDGPIVGQSKHQYYNQIIVYFLYKYERVSMSKYFYRFIWIFEALIALQRVWPNHNTINTTV